MSATTLYSTDVLGLATGLARWPMTDGLPLRGSARSASCGSTLAIGLALDDAGAIARVGLSAQACAIGQAAAALFADHAPGLDHAAIAGAESGLARWLAGEAAMPDWPGLAIIAAAAAYPARHGAILLAWRAALSALSSTVAAG